MTLHIGCGSWADAEYTGVIYPDGLPAKERLSGYAKVFNHVEVNSSYYATPRPPLTAGWVKQTPDGFTFNVKLHRAFSRSPEKTAAKGELSNLLLKGVEPLARANRLGAFLLVLAPDFGPERHTLAELDGLIEQLRPHALAVELRDNAWVAGKQRDATFGYFRERNIAFVGVDMPQIRGATLMPPLDEVTRPDLAYLRLHGRNPGYVEAGSAAERHEYEYSGPELKELAMRVRRLADKAEHVHVIANNHARDFAPKTALALMRLLDGMAGVPPVQTPAFGTRTPSDISLGSQLNQGSKMAKSQNSKKETKKAPQRTAKEKKQAKRDKKG